jgi:hypothetical protein
MLTAFLMLLVNTYGLFKGVRVGVENRKTRNAEGKTLNPDTGLWDLFGKNTIRQAALSVQH